MAMISRFREKRNYQKQLRHNSLIKILLYKSFSISRSESLVASSIADSSTSLPFIGDMKSKQKIRRLISYNAGFEHKKVVLFSRYDLFVKSHKNLQAQIPFTHGAPSRQSLYVWHSVGTIIVNQIY